MTEEYLRGIRDTWFWVAVLAVLVLLVYVVFTNVRRRIHGGHLRLAYAPVDATTQTMATMEAARRKEEMDKLLEAVENLNRSAVAFNKATESVLLFLQEERAVRQQALAQMEREGFTEKAQP